MVESYALFFPLSSLFRLLAVSLSSHIEYIQLFFYLIFWLLLLFCWAGSHGHDMTDALTVKKEFPLSMLLSGQHLIIEYADLLLEFHFSPFRSIVCKNIWCPFFYKHFLHHFLCTLIRSPIHCHMNKAMSITRKQKFYGVIFSLS